MKYTTRQQWGAKYGRGNPTPRPQSGVVIHHDFLRHTSVKTTVEHEIRIMRIIEEHAATTITPTNPRISYHWAVSASGRIYEGLGWNRIGAHVANANTANLGIFFMKDGRTHSGTEAQWRAVSEIVREGIAIGALTKRPLLHSHRDLVATTCPGDALHAKVRSFTLESLLALSETKSDPLSAIPAPTPKIVGVTKPTDEVRVPDLPPGNIVQVLSKSKYLPDVRVEALGNHKYRLMHDVAIYDWIHERRFVIPEGFTYDKASVPRPLWPIMSPQCLGIVAPATHDWIYAMGGALEDAEYTRAESDILFREHMRVEGVSSIRHNAAYRAVRLFGGFAWKG